MKYIFESCKQQGVLKINLEVNSKNQPAINLYKKFGFEQVGRRKNYYKDGDALLFSAGTSSQ